jgi:DNA-directed RNA polymerase beta subunit
MGIKLAFNTGNWKRHMHADALVGVSVPLERNNIIDYYAFLSRCINNIPHKGFSSEPMEVHRTQWGVFCPWATPEDDECGLVHQICIVTHVRPPATAQQVASVVQFCQNNAQQTESHTVYRVLVNGIVQIGGTTQPQEFEESVKRARRAEQIFRYTFIWTDHVDRSIHLSTSWGLPVRPVLVCHTRLTQPNQQERWGKPQLTDDGLQKLCAKFRQEPHKWWSILLKLGQLDHGKQNMCVLRCFV